MEAPKLLTVNLCNLVIRMSEKIWIGISGWELEFLGFGCRVSGLRLRSSLGSYSLKL